MNNNEKPFTGYASGADAWRDNVLSYGLDEAVIICNRYLDIRLRQENSDDEKQHCRKLLTAWYEATADKLDSAKLVYPYDFETANNRMESSYYDESRRRNVECARGIDAIINVSHYEINHYNLRLAAMKAIMDYGFARVNLVLAFNYQNKINDGRLSQTNRQWTNGFIVPEQAFKNSWLQSHATLIEDFTTYVRKLYEDLDAGRYILPGYEEQGENVHGYTVIRKIMLDENDGYVIAHNPDAVDPYVCWKFHTYNGECRYDWGIYGSEQAVADGFIARVFVALN